MDSVGKSALGSTGFSVLSAATPNSARTPTVDQDDYRQREIAELESQFFSTEFEKNKVQDSRRAYPKRKPVKELAISFPMGDEEDAPSRRIMGFSLGFEKIFATTSIKLPVSAYTIFVELHLGHKEQVYSRCFNGLHTVFDLKKWVYEKLLVPMNSYSLSYAEAGKANLTDELRLLTTQDSLDTRTLATTRAVHKMYKGLPGVHSIGDVGVTRLYVRLKCRTCGDLLNSHQTCRKFTSFGIIEPRADNSHQIVSPATHSSSSVVKAGADPNSRARLPTSVVGRVAHDESEEITRIPGKDPSIEDCWYRPDEKKNCLFHGRGYEMYEASRTQGGASDLARIYISCDKEPSKKLRLANNVLSARGSRNISY